MLGVSTWKVFHVQTHFQISNNRRTKPRFPWSERDYAPKTDEWIKLPSSCSQTCANSRSSSFKSDKHFFK